MLSLNRHQPGTVFLRGRARPDSGAALSSQPAVLLCDVLNDRGMEGTFKLDTRKAPSHPADLPPHRLQPLRANADAITVADVYREIP